ncbi:hypothetical protein QYF61_008161, partial [Mycteria americana]
MLEQITLANTSKHMKDKKVAESHQHGFTKGKFMPDQPEAFPHKMSGSVDEGRLVDVVYLDLSMASDTVSHNILVHKLMNYRLDNWTVRWTENWLNCWASKGRDQWHEVQLETRGRYRLQAKQLESSFAEKDWGVLVATKLTNVPLAAMKANSLRGCIRKSADRKVEGSDSALVRLLLGTVFSSGLPSTRKTWTYWSNSSKRVTKMIKGLDRLSYEERLRELELFSLEKRRLRGILSN